MYSYPTILGLEVGTAAQWFAGVATLTAVIVALFGDWLRSHIFRPKLTAKLVSETGEHNLVQYNIPFWEGMPASDQPGILRAAHGIPARFFHMRVSNKRRWPPAKNARLYLVRVEEMQQEEEFRLLWSGELPMSAKNEDLFPPRNQLGPPIDFDVVSADSEGWFHLHTVFNYFLLRQHTKAPLHRRYFFRALSDESETVVVGLEVEWNGSWSDDWNELRKHLHVSEL